MSDRRGSQPPPHNPPPSNPARPRSNSYDGHHVNNHNHHHNNHTNRNPSHIQLPDHGSTYLPGNKSGGDEAFAPKSLDHFKRGYQERADTRPKEYYFQKQQHHQQQHHHQQPQSQSQSSPSQQSQSQSQHNHHHSSHPPSRPPPQPRSQSYPPPHQSHLARGGSDGLNARGGGGGGGGGGVGGNGADGGDAWSATRDRVTVVSGLEIAPLLDQLERCQSSGSSHNDNNNKNGSSVNQIMDGARSKHPEGFDTGKAVTALISGCARRKNTRLAHLLWKWCQARQLHLNTYHYNSMIAVAATDRQPQQALKLMEEMTERRVAKNEVTFSSAITACEKSGDWRTAMALLDGMEKEGLTRTAISFNAAISACEKGMVPQKACEVFMRMKREGIRPSVVTYSALISAAEKGSQWKLALEILEDMKADGFRSNVIAYSAAISALAKGQQWERALELFREIQSTGKQPSIVTYNATMTALEKGLQWERALELFDEMKRTNLPITVVSYGSALSACDKGLQYRQCLEFLDEMTEMGIPKNVIIFGAAMSCMEKCCRADICFQLMDRMKLEGVQPNVHIYNSVISACSRSNLWEKGYELFREMDDVGVKRDVVTFNAVLDAVASQVRLGRTLFEEGVKQGFYARVSRLAKHWFELDLHFLSLGGGEIAMGWWFEECLVPYLVNKCEKLQDVKSISIVTGYGKTRTRGRRQGDDGMRKRCRAMLSFMGIRELEQPNLGRLHIDMESLLESVQKNGGKIVFDLDSYIAWKERETTVNQVPDVPQKIRPRYRPVVPGSGKPPFIRIETESTSPEYRLDAQPIAPPRNVRSGAGPHYAEHSRDSWNGATDHGRARNRSVSDRQWEPPHPSQDQRSSLSRGSSHGVGDPGNGGYNTDARRPSSTADCSSYHNDPVDRRGSADFQHSSGPHFHDHPRDQPFDGPASYRQRGSMASMEPLRSDPDAVRGGEGFPSDRRGSEYRGGSRHGPSFGREGSGRSDDVPEPHRGECRNSSFREHRSGQYGGPSPHNEGTRDHGERQQPPPYGRKRSFVETHDERRLSHHHHAGQQQTLPPPPQQRGYSLEPKPQRQKRQA